MKSADRTTKSASLPGRSAFTFSSHVAKAFVRGDPQRLLAADFLLRSDHSPVAALARHVVVERNKRVVGRHRVRVRPVVVAAVDDHQMVIEHFPHGRLTFGLLLTQCSNRRIVIAGVARHVGGHDHTQLCEPIHQRRSDGRNVLDHPSLVADRALAVGGFVRLQHVLQELVGRHVR